MSVPFYPNMINCSLKIMHDEKIFDSIESGIVDKISETNLISGELILLQRPTRFTLYLLCKWAQEKGSLLDYHTIFVLQPMA